MIGKDEIGPGLVLHMNPDGFSEGEASCTCGPSYQVKGGHFFLCIDGNADSSRWLPLYSEDGKGRTMISESGRTGHPKWTDGTFYWHKDQVWTLDYDAVNGGAKSGKDMSKKGSRNLLDKDDVPEV